MLDINKVTDGDIDGEGYFDRFMKSINNHIQEAVNNNTITQEIAGNVYTGVIPSILSEGIRFEKEKALLDLDVQIKEQELKNIKTQENVMKIEAAIKLLTVPGSTKSQVPQTIIDYVKEHI